MLQNGRQIGQRRTLSFRVTAISLLFIIGSLQFSTGCIERPSLEQIDYGMPMSGVIEIMGKRGDNRDVDTTHGGLLAKETWEYPEGKVVFYGNDVIEVWQYNSEGNLERIIPEISASDSSDDSYREFRYHDSAE
ncbi:MAG: hypothetical protein ABIH86_04405 [Planctomycetota bacterium]